MIIRQSDLCTLAWSYIDIHRFTGHYRFTVFIKRIYQLVIFRQVLKVVLIEDLKYTLFCIYCLYADVLIYLFHFIVLRLRFKVTKHDAVHYKLTIIGSIAKVSTVSQITDTCLRVIIVHRLVYPIPNGTSTEEIGRLHSFPVIYQITAGIPH